MNHTSELPLSEPSCQNGEPLNLEIVRELVGDLRNPRPMIYFVDLIVSAGMGWMLLGVSILGHPSWGQWPCFVMSLFLLYRALAFVHELFHQQRMKAFRFVWHVAIGIPLLIPFLLYLPIHQRHHSSETYGTVQDGEYEELHGRCISMTLKLFAMNLVVPFALLIRFGVLTPLSVLWPTVRREIIPSFIHLALRLPYKAPEIKAGDQRECYAVEAACMFVAWGLVALIGSEHTALFAWWAGLVIGVTILNTVRGLCSTHLYVEKPVGRGAREQLLDSINITGGNWLITELFCPVGLRYHALHHIAPYIPYHELGKAHFRLIQKLPADSEYHRASVSTLWYGWKRLKQSSNT